MAFAQKTSKIGCIQCKNLLVTTYSFFYLIGFRFDNNKEHENLYILMCKPHFGAKERKEVKC